MTEIIDAHAHIYPQKIAQKATEAIGAFYDIPMGIEAGTPENLLRKGSKAGITKYVVHSCATKPQQVRAINEFIKKEIDEHKEFIGFMTLHPDLTKEEMDEEVKWCIDNGFQGVKLHPDFQRFNIDSEGAEKIYSAVGSKLPILLHTGDNRYDYSKPFRLVNMAKKHTEVRFIGAHFGGYRCWDDAYMYKGLNNVWFDTSSSLPFISVEKAKSIIDMLGYEKFFFGVDFPMWDASEELERFYKIPLTEKERQAILSGNIKKLLSL